MLILKTVRAASEAEIAVRRGEWRGRLQPTPGKDQFRHIYSGNSLI